VIDDQQGINGVVMDDQSASRCAVLCDKAVVGGYGKEVVVGKSLALDDKGAARESLEDSSGDKGVVGGYGRGVVVGKSVELVELDAKGATGESLAHGADKRR